VGFSEARNLQSFPALSWGQARAARHPQHWGKTMDSLLKGGVLWLMGVPILGVILLKLIGWI
jgi:hypothetical protein